MKLKRLSYRNFQAHRRTVLELDPGVTVLCGKTNAAPRLLQDRSSK